MSDNMGESQQEPLRAQADQVEGMFPADCLGPTDAIPRASPTGIVPGALFKVIATEAYSPSHLWLQCRRKGHISALKRTEHEMTHYYGGGDTKSCELPAGAARVGLCCAGLFYGHWHRLVVVKVLDRDTVKVRFVDYGTVESLAVRKLRLLRRDWGTLPAQALRARLAGVQPAGGATHWSHDAALHLRRLAQGQELDALVVAIDPHDDSMQVKLMTAVGRSLVRELVAAGHASLRRGLALQMSRCYLYPYFSALEFGATCSRAELCVYQRDGVSLDCVRDYRLHVPRCLPDVPPVLPSEPPGVRPPVLPSVPAPPVPKSVESLVPPRAAPRVPSSMAPRVPSRNPPGVRPQKSAKSLVPPRAAPRVPSSMAPRLPSRDPPGVRPQKSAKSLVPPRAAPRVPSSMAQRLPSRDPPGVRPQKSAKSLVPPRAAPRVPSSMAPRLPSRDPPGVRPQKSAKSLVLPRAAPRVPSSMAPRVPSSVAPRVPPHVAPGVPPPIRPPASLQVPPRAPPRVPRTCRPPKH